MVSDASEGIVRLGLKWSPRFFAIGVVIDIFLLMLIYWTGAKQIAFSWHRYVSYWGIWTGLRLIHGVPTTGAVQFFALGYVVILAGLQAFALGFIFDLFLSSNLMPVIRRNVDSESPT
jgi:hypothetical protein